MGRQQHIFSFTNPSYLHHRTADETGCLLIDSPLYSRNLLKADLLPSAKAGNLSRLPMFSVKFKAMKAFILY
jgi:hypothetical protein